MVRKTYPTTNRSTIKLFFEAHQTQFPSLERHNVQLFHPAGSCLETLNLI